MKGIKKIDNAISWIRSAGKNMAEAAFVKGSASREIRASAKRIQDLLKSIENKSQHYPKMEPEKKNRGVPEAVPGRPRPIAVCAQLPRGCPMTPGTRLWVFGVFVKSA